jgi:hypothetical protein
MTNGKSTLSHGAVGVLIAVVIIAGFVAGNYLFQPAKGTLTIMIMDEPVPLLNLNMTIDWVKIKDDAGNWYDLTIATPNAEGTFYFDLLKLQNVSETLSVTEIPAANYTAIWIHVLTANATGLEDEFYDLTVPSNVTKVLLKPYLNLEAEGQVTVLIDLQPEDMETIAISQSLNLRPVIKAIVIGTAPEVEP